MGKVRIIDVANHAGVSKSTVSQYLNGRFGHMSEQTREKIKQAVKDLDYVPNPIARSLKTDKTKTIGLIVRDVAGFHSSQVIRGIDDYCKSHNYNVIIYNTDFDAEAEANSLKSLKEMCVDGIIIASSGKNMPLLHDYIHQSIPIVQFQIEYEPDSANIVVSDYLKSTFEATEYLITLGHKNICLLTQCYEHITSRMDRIEGYKMALEKHGIDFKQELIQHWDRKIGFKTQPSKVLTSDIQPTVFFSQHLAITVDLLKDLEANHISIPDDVSVLSFDELPMAEFFKVPITSIKQDPYRIGSESAKLLMAEINGKPLKENRIVIPCTLIKRQSCKQISTNKLN